MTVCMFTTDFSSRCACPEALEKPKGLDGCLPSEWKARGSCKRCSLCLHPPMSLGDEDRIMLNAGDISKEL